MTLAALRDTLRALAADWSADPGDLAVQRARGAARQSCRIRSRKKSCPLPPPRGVLSGPSFAQEVARGIPAAVTLASEDAAFSARLARELHTLRLRVYSSQDVIGVEVGGAAKNVIAIAAGISDGLGFGESARAALITRGLAEITRLGLQAGRTA